MLWIASPPLWPGWRLRSLGPTKAVELCLTHSIQSHSNSKWLCWCSYWQLLGPIYLTQNVWAPILTEYHPTSLFIDRFCCCGQNLIFLVSATSKFENHNHKMYHRIIPCTNKAIQNKTGKDDQILSRECGWLTDRITKPLSLKFLSLHITSKKQVAFPGKSCYIFCMNSKLLMFFVVCFFFFCISTFNLCEWVLDCLKENVLSFKGVHKIDLDAQNIRETSQ